MTPENRHPRDCPRCGARRSLICRKGETLTGKRRRTLQCMGCNAAFHTWESPPHFVGEYQKRRDQQRDGDKPSAA